MTHNPGGAAGGREPVWVGSILVQLAAANAHRRGVWSYAQAREAGLGKATLEVLVRGGRVWRPAWGWYALADPSDSAPERHAQRIHAVLARQRGRTVASHYSALVLLGAPTIGCDLDTVHVTRVGAGSFRSGPGLVVHMADGWAPAAVGALTAASTLGALAAASTLGAGTVSPEDALIQTGLVAGAPALVVAGDHLLRRGVTTRARLDEALCRYRGNRDVSAVHTAVKLLDTGSESAGESLLRYALLVLGYRVRTQVPVAVGGRRCRLDLAIDGTRLALEFDGRAKYVDPLAWEREVARQQALESVGWVFLRLRWAHLFRTSSTELDLDGLRDRVERGLTRAAQIARPA